MKMYEVKVTKENVFDLVEDPSIYVIGAYGCLDGFWMQQANRVSLPELLSKQNRVIKLEKNEV